MTSLLDGVDVIDAGDKLMFTAEHELILKNVVESLIKDGARNVTVPVKVGRKWMAFCAHPEVDACRVEVLGYTIIISGPSANAVRLGSNHYRELGALITEGPILQNSEWKLYLEDTGARTGNTINGG